jgi:ABC-2 type transport system permease protein
LVTVLQAQAYHPDAGFYDYVAISQWAFLFLQAIFMSLGILLGCAMKSHKRAGSTAVSILLGAYFTSALSGLSDGLDFLRYLTPFEYFDSLRMLRLSGIELSSVLLSGAIILVALSAAYFAYSRRDLYI